MYGAALCYYITVVLYCEAYQRQSLNYFVAAVSSYVCKSRSAVSPRNCVTEYEGARVIFPQGSEVRISGCFMKISELDVLRVFVVYGTRVRVIYSVILCVVRFKTTNLLTNDKFIVRPVVLKYHLNNILAYSMFTERKHVSVSSVQSIHFR